MNAGQKRVVAAGMGVILAGALAVLGLWLGRGDMVRKTGFMTPSMEERAESGEPAELPETLQYQEFEVAAGNEVGLALKPRVKDREMTTYFVAKAENTDFLRLRVLSEEKEKLAETGLIEPGSFVEKLWLSREVADGEAVVIEIMTYAPETFYSDGTTRIKLLVQAED